LDPQNRANIWEYIRNLREQKGMTLLLTTHYMDEAEALANRVAIIDHGRIVAEGAPRHLIDQMGADVIHMEGKGSVEPFITKIETLPFVQSINTGNGLVQIGVDTGNRRLADIVITAAENGFTIEDISVAKPSLGDVFLQVTGRQLRDR
jgi:ABC-2 type transport system ATP-binding protein